MPGVFGKPMQTPTPDLENPSDREFGLKNVGQQFQSPGGAPFILN